MTDRDRMRIAYLVNQYPQPSQAFIRREIDGHAFPDGIFSREVLPRHRLVDDHDGRLAGGIADTEVPALQHRDPQRRQGAVVTA